MDAGDAAPLVVGVEGQEQADRILDAADETHAGVGLVSHDAASLCGLHYSIDTGIDHTSAVRSCLLIPYCPEPVIVLW
jgi:hypothetical protein